jgi:hypothetical protein
MALLRCYASTWLLNILTLDNLDLDLSLHLLVVEVVAALLSPSSSSIGSRTYCRWAVHVVDGPYVSSIGVCVSLLGCPYFRLAVCVVSGRYTVVDWGVRMEGRAKTNHNKGRGSFS